MELKKINQLIKELKEKNEKEMLDEIIDLYKKGIINDRDLAIMKAYNIKLNPDVYEEIRTNNKVNIIGVLDAYKYIDNLNIDDYLLSLERSEHNIRKSNKIYVDNNLNNLSIDCNLFNILIYEAKDYELAKQASKIIGKAGIINFGLCINDYKIIDNYYNIKVPVSILDNVIKSLLFITLHGGYAPGVDLDDVNDLFSKNNKCIATYACSDNLINLTWETLLKLREIDNIKEVFSIVKGYDWLLSSQAFFVGNLRKNTYYPDGLWYVSDIDANYKIQEAVVFCWIKE